MSPDKAKMQFTYYITPHLHAEYNVFALPSFLLLCYISARILCSIRHFSFILSHGCIHVLMFKCSSTFYFEFHWRFCMPVAAETSGFWITIIIEFNFSQ